MGKVTRLMLERIRSGLTRTLRLEAWSGMDDDCGLFVMVRWKHKPSVAANLWFQFGVSTSKQGGRAKALAFEIPKASPNAEFSLQSIASRRFLLHRIVQNVT